MFGFLKEKLKGALQRFTKGVDEKAKTEEVKEVVEKKAKPAKQKPVQKQKKIIKEIKKTVPPQKEKQKKEKVQEKIPEPVQEPAPEPVVEEKKEEKQGFFGRLKEKFFKKEETESEEEKPEEAEVEALAPQPEFEEPKTQEPKAEAEELEEQEESETAFNEIFEDLEIALLENNVAVEVIEKIKQDLKEALVDKKITRGKIEETIAFTLKKSIADLFNVKPIDLLSEAKKKKPYVIAFVGVNGSGKTTTIAKLAYFFQQKGMKPVIVAADTFRAAAIQQLEEHANKLNVKLIKHDYGADPAAVAFDGVKYAQLKQMDVVLIDTAGRLHSNTNLMDEMKKIIRVAKPDLKLFIGEAITGNDCVEQATQFNEAIGIDGMILCKADVDEKGGAAISVSYVTGKPILYLGTGQKYEDLKPFDTKLVLGHLGL
ncbi:MAG: fused signal recognition particle receptor [archaeon GW2011_AR16]|nr:MAG: fused signal recognition particle receptor [archaeon GW2011_AR16]